MRRMTMGAALLAASTFLTSPVSAADEFAPAMQAFLENNITAWANDPVLLDALRGANDVTAGYSDAEINALDQAWRAEVGTGTTPTITPVLNNAAADFLRSQIDASGGAISEAFLMDSVGLNVAASGVTSDMWQGDEAKFTATYGAGAGSIHIGDVELDESTQSYQGQISLTIVDPATGEMLGAMTVGVDAEALL